MTELTALKGIGAKYAEALGRLGIFKAEDLIDFYPRDFEVYESPVNAAGLVPGKVQSLRAILTSEPSLNRYKGLIIVNAYVSDLSGKVQVSWFNAPFIRKSLKVGVPYVFRGRVYEKNGRISMSQPKIYEESVYKDKYEGKLSPIYSLTKGLSNNIVLKAVSEAFKVIEGRANREYLPNDIIKSTGLMGADEASLRIHFPRSKEEYIRARDRMAFDELFTLLLSTELFNKKIVRTGSTHKCKPDLRLLKFMAGLPFELTGDQTKAYKEIIKDMSGEKAMNRLLEGDTGSGKTIVAFLALINAALNGYEAVLMAPTAVLARQHLESLENLIYSDSEKDENGIYILGDIRLALLTGDMSEKEKGTVREKIATHEVDIIIGTHALFTDKVTYKDLGLVITDEQHKFGVAQREALFNKGDAPHSLVMSATPIPRTLSMIIYNGMDISRIEEKPAGRIPIKNAVVGRDYEKRALKFIYDEVKKGHSAYIICPAIEGGDEENADGTELTCAKDYYAKCVKAFPPDVGIGLLHGRMKDADKEKVMNAFKDGLIKILVSTTVVEVGIDVRKATVIMVQNADRFGLSELHQLRGRVGRGDFESYAIFVNSGDSDKATERLNVLKTTNDGFKIAEEDLRLRGPGDIFGVRQSGEMDFKVADIYRDAGLLFKAKDIVKSIMDEDPRLKLREHEALKRHIDKAMDKGNIA